MATAFPDCNRNHHGYLYGLVFFVFSTVKEVGKKTAAAAKDFIEQSLTTVKMIFFDSCSAKYKTAETCRFVSDKMAANRRVLLNDLPSKVQKL